MIAVKAAGLTEMRAHGGTKVPELGLTARGEGETQIWLRYLMYTLAYIAQNFGLS